MKVKRWYIRMGSYWHTRSGIYPIDWRYIEQPYSCLFKSMDVVTTEGVWTCK